MSLKKDLENHDWYHMMSDDGNVYNRGRSRANKLFERVTQLGGKYRWWDIHAAIRGHVAEEMVPHPEGGFITKQAYERYGFKTMAPISADSCITAQLRDDIMNFLEAAEHIEAARKLDAKDCS